MRNLFLGFALVLGAVAASIGHADFVSDCAANLSRQAWLDQQTGYILANVNYEYLGNKVVGESEFYGQASDGSSVVIPFAEKFKTVAGPVFYVTGVDLALGGSLKLGVLFGSDPNQALSTVRLNY